MNENVKADFLLESNNVLYFLLDEFLIFIVSDLTLAKPGTSIADVFGLLWGRSQNNIAHRKR